MKNKKYLNDIILIIVFVIAAAISFIIYNSGKENGDTVIVKLNDQVIETFDLNVDGEYSINGGSNILVIKDGKAYMKDANCPDKLCVTQGKIKSSNQCITCLPNHITVTIDSKNKEVDLVS